MLNNVLDKTTNKTLESQYITKPTNVCDELEIYINRIFEKELATENSVLLAYNPFVIKKSIRQAEQFSTVQLIGALEQLLIIETMLKSTSVNGEELLEQFVIELCYLEGK